MSDYPPGLIIRPIDVWPAMQTTDRRRSRFDSPWSSTMEILRRELRALGPYGLRSVDNTYYYPKSILQIALRERDFRIDGMPRADAKPSHPGVILSIEPKGKPPLTLPCDAFDRWQDNLHGIAKGLESLRLLSRYGIVQSDQQYRGWQAIEATSTSPAFNVEQAEAYLRSVAADEGDELDLGTLSQLHRRAARNAHPDRNGGDRTTWDLVEKASAVLRAAGRLS